MKKQSSERQLVVQDNILIEKAKYKMTLNQKKFVLWAISKIKPAAKPHAEYTYPIGELANMIGISMDTAYHVVIQLSVEILQKPIKLSPDANTTIVCHWFEAVRYKRNEATVTFRIGPEIAPYLLNLKKQFTSYQLKNAIQLKSVFSIRLYELLKQYLPVGEKEIKLGDLKETLGLGTKYKQYGHFKNKALEVAQKELKAKTDIRFTYNELKTGRRVSAILFKIHSNTKATKEVSDEIYCQYENNPEMINLLTLIPDQHRHKKTLQTAILNALAKHNQEYVAQNILYSNEKAKENYRIFLIKALKENWSLGWWEDHQVEQKQRIEQKQERQKEQEKEEKRKEDASEFRQRIKKIELLKDQFPDLYAELRQIALENLTEKEKEYKPLFFESVLQVSMSKLVDDFFIRKERL